MGNISICDLEIQCRVGVTDPERSKPQRLLISIDMAYDFTAATISDRIEETIDYHKVVQDLIALSQAKSWKLIEKVAADIAERVLYSFGPESVTVQVKKFVIPEAQYVAVTLTQTRPGK